MAKYPTSKNIPTLVIDNVAQRFEIKDTTNYTTGGLWDQNTTRFTDISVNLATTTVLPTTVVYDNAAGTITAGSNAAVLGTIDGVVTTNGMTLLVKNQAAAAQNGIYTVTTIGSAGTVSWVLTRKAGVLDTSVLLSTVRPKITTTQGTIATYYMTLSAAINSTSPQYTLGTTTLAFSTTVPTSGALSTVADTVLSLNNLITDLDALSAVLPGISQASGSRAYTASTNGAFTALEQKFAAQEYSRNLRRAQAHAQLVSKLIVNLTSQLSAISTATQPAVNRYPSAKNRDGF